MSPNLLGMLAISLVLGGVALWFKRIRDVAIPENRIPFVAVFIVGALLGVVSLFLGPSWPVGVVAGLTSFGGAFFAFTVGISEQKLGQGAIGVGDRLPAFTAIDEDGASFDSACLTGHPVLIKFFRGHW